MGRFDASYGTTLLGNANHRFSYVEACRSGLCVKGEVRDIATLHTGRKDSLIVVAMNNEPLYMFKKK